VKIFIKIQGPTGAIKHYPIEERPITIGRKIAAKVCIDDDEMSGVHLRLYVQDGSLYVEDLGSKNGTSLNGIRIFNQRFCHKDTLLVGSTKITIDGQKNDAETLKKLARKGTGITLNLQTKEETFKDVRRKTIISKRATNNSKLYHEQRKQSKKTPSKKHELKEAVALTIDLALALCVFVLCLYAGQFVFPGSYEAMQTKAVSAYLEGDMLFISALSAVLACASFFLNRGKGNRASLGEMLVKLD